MNKNMMRVALIALLCLAIAAFFYFDVKQYLTLEAIKAQKADLEVFYNENTFLTVAGFMLVYITITALSLPFATVLTLLAGALFGFAGGLAVASFSSSIGATLAFLMARFVARDAVQTKYAKQLEKINAGLEKEGAFYLFAMRLTPVFPFFMVNIVMGVLAIRTIVFYIVSQIGMLPGTAVYVYAGTELAQINSLSDIASPSLIASFVALGLFPLIAKKTLNLIRKKKANA